MWGEGDSIDQALIDHDCNLRKLLEKAEQHNPKFNKGKTKLRQTEVKFMGHLFMADGMNSQTLIKLVH